MILEVEAGRMLERARMGYASSDEVEEWADDMIAQLDDPPLWLLELSVESTGRIHDKMKLLGRWGSELTKFERLQITLAEHSKVNAELPTTLKAIFRIWSPADGEAKSGADEIPSEILDLIVEWDCRDFFPDGFPDDYVERCSKAFEAVLDNGS